MGLAIQYKYFDVIKYFIEEKRIANKGFLSLACYSSGNLDLLKYLVEKGADVHERDDIVLINVARYGDIEMLEYLIECGIDIKNRGSNALYNMCQFGGNPDIAEYLLKNGINNDDAFIMALESGYELFIELFINYGYRITQDILDELSPSGTRHVAKYFINH